MSRYIDVDALTEFVERRFDITWEHDYDGGFKDACVAILLNAIEEAPSTDIVRCSECEYWVSDGGALMICDIHKDPTVPEHFCSYGSRSEKPNNCEHITEDGVTCAKYPACDDCLDNPLNKVKGSERLVKGSERSSE